MGHDVALGAASFVVGAVLGLATVAAAIRANPALPIGKELRVNRVSSALWAATLFTMIFGGLQVSRESVYVGPLCTAAACVPMAVLWVLHNHRIKVGNQGVPPTK